MNEKTEDKDRKPSRLTNFSMDSHQFKHPLSQDEITLHSSETLFRTMSENSSIGNYIIQDGILSYVNSALEKVFRYDPGELIGTDPLLLIHSNDQVLVSENIQRRVSGEINSIHYEYLGRCKNGDTKNIEDWGSREIIDNQVAVFGTIIDITDRKKEEAKLSERESTFRGLFENAPIGILHSLPEGRFLRVNCALAQILGYQSPEELVSQVTNIKAQIYVDSDKRREDLDEILNNNDWFHTDNRYRRKDGSILDVKLTARKVLKPDGTIAYFEGFVEGKN
ncbi:PAS domain-containing protein [Chloroflexota bacterium]